MKKTTVREKNDSTQKISKIEASVKARRKVHKISARWLSRDFFANIFLTRLSYRSIKPSSMIPVWVNNAEAHPNEV